MINLQSFCGNDREIRTHLRAPFELDGYVYATNGHLLVRVPAGGYPGNEPFQNGLHPKNVIDLVADALAAEGEYIAFPEMQEPAKCSRCNGTGIDPDDDEDGPEDCWDCAGSGYERTIKKVGDTTFGAHYVWRLSQLPGATIKPRGMKKAAAIKFDGGEALLMPCRP